MQVMVFMAGPGPPARYSPYSIAQTRPQFPPAEHLEHGVAAVIVDRLPITRISRDQLMDEWNRNAAAPRPIAAMLPGTISGPAAKRRERQEKRKE